MTDFVNEEAINNIQRKLCEGRQLEPYEIIWVTAALRKTNDCKQTPYYEVVYHDEYDRQERRIMNPTSYNLDTIPGDEDYFITRDSFEINFNRIVPRKPIS